MKALLWKELRENLKWALLAAVALGAALTYGLYQTEYGQISYSIYDGITLCRKQFLLVTTFAFPAVGLFLGLVQILPELKRDRWAALLHRPATPGAIFLGKVTAGMLLYAFAAGVPFALAVWLVATPGNFAAPFVPGLALPGLADLLTGTVYYFAALTLALQRGGWVGLRVFPLLAAVFVSYFAANTGLFRVAAESAVAMSLALGIAAWGAVQKPDSFAARPWGCRLAFLAVVFYGACGLGELGKSLLKAVGPTPQREWMNYELGKDGMPLRVTYLNGVVAAVADAQGNPINDPKYSPDRVRNETQHLNYVSNYIGDSHGWKPRPWNPRYRETGRYLDETFSYSRPRVEQWFSLRQQRSWVAYRPEQKTAVARLDARGFQPMSADPQPFPENEHFDQLGQDRTAIWNQDGVRVAYLARREIRPLELPGKPPVYGLTTAWVSAGQGSVNAVAVALAEGIAVYDNREKPVAYLPFTREVERWGQISFGINSHLDRFYVWYQPSAWIKRPEAKKMSSYLDEVDRNGRVLRSAELKPLPDFARPPSLTQILSQRLQSPAFFLGEMGYRKIGEWAGSERLKQALSRQLGDEWPNTRERMLWTLGISAGFAILAFWQTRRRHFSLARSLAWAGFVLAFNLAGFLTFLLVVDWPKQVACAHCKHRRPVNRSTCPACGNGWPSPPRTGIEIFGPASQQPG